MALRVHLCVAPHPYPSPLPFSFDCSFRPLHAKRHQPRCRNYVKFLVDRDGRPAKRFGPSFDPLRFEADVRLLLSRRDVTPEECVMHPGRKVCNADRILGEL
jgi:hypothetical protein